MTTRYKVWFRVEPDGEDPHTFPIMIPAMSLAAAIKSVKQQCVHAVFASWQHFNEVLATWVTIWPDGREDQMEKLLVSAPAELQDV